MKIMKFVILILLFLFVFINSIFFLMFVYSEDKKNMDKGKKSNYERMNGSDVKYLQKIVDFNSTTFENNGIVHFYNAAYQRFILDNVSPKLYDYSYNKQNQSFKDNDYNSTNEKFSIIFYYDSEYKILIDSNLNFCFQSDFDYLEYKCSEKLIKLINRNFTNPYNPLKTKSDEFLIEHNCDVNLKCCDKEYKCIYKCMEGLQADPGQNTHAKMNEHIFEKCHKACRIKINTKKFPKPFCYLIGDMNINKDLNITVSLADL